MNTAPSEGANPSAADVHLAGDSFGYEGVRSAGHPGAAGKAHSCNISYARLAQKLNRVKMLRWNAGPLRYFAERNPGSVTATGDPIALPFFGTHRTTCFGKDYLFS